MSDIPDDQDLPKSKSQTKREMSDLKNLGEKLLDLKQDQLAQLADERLVEAVNILRNLKKGPSKKRQIQYIGKLMRNTDIDAVTELLEKNDNRSKQNVLVLHKIERWRDALLKDDQILSEICAECPQIDRQHLRSLVRSAISESKRHSHDLTHYRKLFRYLRDVVEEIQEE